MSRVIRATDCRSMPWKNGGGTTTEVTAHPPGARLDDFEWRVSLATVTSDGPFSTFPGVERTLTVLEGDGLRLAIGDAAPIELRATSAPLSFAADTPTRAALLGTAVTDLNVMTRRDQWRHAVTRLTVDGPTQHAIGRSANPLTLLWLCHRGQVEIAGADGTVRLGPLDAWLVEPAPATRWRVVPQGPAELFLIELKRLPVCREDVQVLHAAVEFEK